MILQNRPLFIVNISNPRAFSGNGSIIMLELTDEHAALRVAAKIASETGRTVTVRNENMEVIGRLGRPPSIEARSIAIAYEFGCRVCPHSQSQRLS
ncbi:hypothetical protein [Bradyrhizobium sp. CCBAU 53421]|uniref:hypothetical protein n=1 Tax=Bradyrhizobium sp. CCBAU 53421 TaxID=1325120 RepID=UPI00188B84B5|nr:hypothetical protein [Bradyrhizobium sp. CCBAU 53421]